MKFQIGQTMTNDLPVSATARIQVRKTNREQVVSDYVVGEEPLEIRARLYFRMADAMIKVSKE